MTDLHPLAGRSFAQEFEAQASPSCIGVTLYETLDDPPDLHTIGYRGARIPEPFDTLAKEAIDCKGWQEARLPVLSERRSGTRGPGLAREILTSKLGLRVPATGHDADDLELAMINTATRESRSWRLTRRSGTKCCELVT